MQHRPALFYPHAGGWKAHAPRGMMGSVQVIVSHYDWLKRGLTDDVRAEVTRLAAQGAEWAIKGWYKKLPEDYFDGPNHPNGIARTFAQPLSSDWHAEVEDDGFTLHFKHNRQDGNPWGLRLQQYGGTITPQKVKALTIPIDPRAHGMRAEQFSEKIHRLFAIGTKQATGDKAGTLVWEDDAGELHAAYALRKRATIKPLMKRRGHDAIPTQEELTNMVRPYFESALKYALSKA